MLAGTGPEPMMDVGFPELSEPKTPTNTDVVVVPPLWEVNSARESSLEQLLMQAIVLAVVPLACTVVLEQNAFAPTNISAHTAPNTNSR